MKSKKLVLLAILDGFGIAHASDTNAVSVAKMPHYGYLKATYPMLEIHASGKWVGLPNGQMGNSEVGHLHIGAGRILYQSLTLINNAISDGSFKDNVAIIAAINHAQENNSKLHLIGLVSDGGVHAHINHLLAILKIAANMNFKDVYIHAILDGRDTKQDVATTYLHLLEKTMEELKVGTLASVLGRYYAMDRDRRWERVKIATDVLIHHQGTSFTNVFDYIKYEYQHNRYDEFIMPAYNKLAPSGMITDNDSVIFTNFRPDRAIQLAAILTNPDYEPSFNISFQNLFFVTMTKYSDNVKENQVAFANQNVSNGLGEWVSNQGLTQLRIAETEKYAHVTYFFDGGRDIIFPGEKRILIPSPKVATYDLKPEMSANEIVTALILAINSNKYNLIVLNFANPDMVGHTGSLEATIKALEVIDSCLQKIYQPLKEQNGIMVLTADHGNAEVMIDENGAINKKHTSQPVPLLITKKNLKLKTSSDYGLANVAPTICDLLDISIPSEMSQESVIKK